MCKIIFKHPFAPPVFSPSYEGEKTGGAAGQGGKGVGQVKVRGGRPPLTLTCPTPSPPCLGYPQYGCRLLNKEMVKMENKRAEEVTLLGKQNVKIPNNYCPEILETFINKHQDNDYFVKFNCPEFTSLCPITGQPDFACIYISYVPAEKMVESKSLKLYLFSFRNHGDFHEDCVNTIMKDLIKLMSPKYIEVWGKFTPRGGISIDPYCNYGKPGTPWEKVAFDRLVNHDMYPEKIDNR